MLFGRDVSLELELDFSCNSPLEEFHPQTVYPSICTVELVYQVRKRNLF